MTGRSERPSQDPKVTLTNATGLLFSLLALAAVACGGASAPAKIAPSREGTMTEEETSEPRTVQEAQERIARARASLEGQHRVSAEPSRAESSAQPSEPLKGGDRNGAEEKPENACATPCRALASMKRAVLALCRMTGDDDNRCVDAKRTLSESTARVSSCRCEGR